MSNAVNGWRTVRLKRLVDLRAGDAITSDQITPDGEYPVYGGNGMRGYTSAFTHSGEHVLVGRQGALCGNVNRASGRFWASEHAIVGTPLDGVDVRWLAGLLESMNLNQYSQSAAQPGLSVEVLANLAVSVPAASEQRAIADYLDRETARIDALIAAKQRLVGLLAAKAIAYVAEHPYVSAAPRVALGRLVRRMEQGWSPQCDAWLPEGDEWGVLKVGCVNGGRFSPEELKALPTELSPKEEYLVHDGELLMSRANNRELVGSAAVVSNVRPRTLLSDKLYRFEVEPTVAVEFISLWLRTPEARDVIELEATGASDSMQNIGQDTVRRIPLPLLPLNAQSRFVAECHHVHASIRSVTDAISKQVLLLREHRQALITATVAGDLSVPVPA